MTTVTRALASRRPSDWVLLAITLGELAWYVADGLEAVAWAEAVYLAQHAIVIFVALLRQAPQKSDERLTVGALCVLSYAYGYVLIDTWDLEAATVIAPDLGAGLVAGSTVFALVALATLGRSFGVRPALRRLVTVGPYRLVRHPIYLSYLVSDVGLGLLGVNLPFVVLVLLGWGSLVARIELEERMLAHSPRWQEFAERTRYRLVPGLY